MIAGSHSDRKLLVNVGAVKSRFWWWRGDKLWLQKQLFTWKAGDEPGAHFQGHLVPSCCLQNFGLPLRCLGSHDSGVSS